MFDFDSQVSDAISFVALGDSLTYGVGDAEGNGWRGWARILAEALAEHHAVSFFNAAVPGATTADVRKHQLALALDHQPHVASLIVGLNDVMRSSWTPDKVHADLLHCASELDRRGAVLLTARFHDHGRVLHLPRILGRPFLQRIEAINAACDEIQATYGGISVDLAAQSEIYSASVWSMDRLHPSELGHRMLARKFGELINDRGLRFELPSIACSGKQSTTMDRARWLVTEVGPWIGRRARDFAPSTIRFIAAESQARLSRRRAIAKPAIGDGNVAATI